MPRSDRGLSDGSGGLLGRGVYTAPWVGPNNELVLVAITHDHKLCGAPILVPRGADHRDAVEELWDRLDTEDPPPPNLELFS